MPSAERFSWEWRTFDYQAPVWKDALDAVVWVTEVALSVETFLLSRRTAAQVKVCDGQVEVKRCAGRDDHGLQQWEHALFADLPLSADQFDLMLDALGCDTPASVPPLGSSDQLLAFMQLMVPAIDAVTLHVWRRQLHLGSCLGERFTLFAGGYIVEGLSLTHRDPDVLLATLYQVNLPVEGSTTFPQVIKRILGWPVGEDGAAGAPGWHPAP